MLVDEGDCCSFGGALERNEECASTSEKVEKDVCRQERLPFSEQRAKGERSRKRGWEKKGAFSIPALN